MPKTPEGKPAVYINPVYPHSFPDPFVLKFRGEYFAYCTGDREDGKIFGILRSRDLVNWTPAGSAMEPLASGPPFYWAPEVVYENGKFYLYYSAGNEILMEIRVAVSERPEGGFVDAGIRLTREEFAIDAHIFIDDDRTRYMFYATDFLEHSHIGTGTVVDRMVDWKTLEGNPRPVTRAMYDWQVYDPARKEKGGVRWYTVEGPTVLKRKGKYFEMFSGGNWQNRSYGVSFAVTESMKFDDEWTQFSDGENILPILRTIPGKVVGPGHNSVVRGPNNRELYCVYHRWTDAGRVLAIDRLDFVGDRMFVAGPTTTEQPMPFRPISSKCLIGDAEIGWSWQKDELVNAAQGRSELTILPTNSSFLLEFTFRLSDVGPGGRLTVKIGDGEFELAPGSRIAALRSGDGRASEIGLPADFDLSALHLLRIEKSIGHCSVMIDDIGNAAELSLEEAVSNFTVIADDLRAAISAMELTPGFEERFQGENFRSPIVLQGSGKIFDGSLTLTPVTGPAEATMSVPFAEFELAANLAADSETGEYGLVLIGSGGEAVAQLLARLGARRIRFEILGEPLSIEMPDAFTGAELRQFRLVRHADHLSAYLDGILFSEHKFDKEIKEAAIRTTTEISIETVRLTAI